MNVLTAMSLTIQAFWDMTLHHWASSSYIIRGKLVDPEDEGTIIEISRIPFPVTQCDIPEDFQLQKPQISSLYDALLPTQELVLQAYFDVQKF
jgi:hypothetical protein